MADKQIINGYSIEDRIAFNEFGGVFRVYSLSLKQHMRLDIFLNAERLIPDGVQGFKTRVSRLLNVRHPHILTIHEYWQDDTDLYLITLDIGVALDANEHWYKGELSLSDITKLVQQITSALTILHQHNILHRHIHPYNIYVDATGDYYLSGFEEILLHPPDNTDDTNDTHVVIGSSDYIAPELITGKMITFKADMYSLGVVIWEALAGERSFAGASPIERIYKHLNEPLPIISTVSDAVNAVIQKATAKNPADRYADMQEFGAAFVEAATSENT